MPERCSNLEAAMTMTGIAGRGAQDQEPRKVLADAAARLRRAPGVCC